MATKRSKTPPPPGLLAADVERLDTWMPEIADKMLGLGKNLGYCYIAMAVRIS